MPLTPEYIKNLCFTPAVFQKGVAYYNNRRVTEIEYGQEQENRKVSAIVEGSRSYHTAITLTPDEEELLTYSCQCPAHDTYPGPCKHVVALALAYGAAVESHNRSDAGAALLLQKYAKKSLARTAAPASRRASLVPTLYVRQEGEGALLSLKIGVDRLYIVKHFQNFVQALQNGETLAYGKKFSMTHSVSNFDEQSAALAQFFLTYFHDLRTPYSGGYSYGYYDPRYVSLTPYLLDELMKLYQNRDLNLEERNTEAPRRVVFENPRLRLHLKPYGNGYVLRMSKPFSMLGGCGRIYLALSGDPALYACEPDFSDAAHELLEMLKRTKGRQLYFAKADMPAVVSTLLPALEPFIQINSEDLSDFLPPPLVSKIFLDMPAPDIVTAQPVFYYGQKGHPGFLEKNARHAYDLAGEACVESLLLGYFPPPDSDGILWLKSDEDALFQLVEKGIPAFSEVAEVYVSDALKAVRVHPPAAVSVGVRMESNLLRITFDVRGMDLAELEEALASYRKAKKYHRLRDGSFLSLDENAMSEFSQLAEGLDLTAKEIMSGSVSVEKYRALHLDALLRQSERLQYDRDSAFKRIVRDVRSVDDTDFALPSSLRPILRNYQKTGYRWLRTIAAYGFGGILADDMGLGKTLQVLSLLLAQKEENPQHSVSIVVCPSSLVLNWQSEAQKFAPALKAVALVGTAEARAAQLADWEAADLLITSYDLLKRDVEQYTGKRFHYVIADEAQYMKNQNTQNAKAVKTLQSAARLALTGTPVENSLAEVWSIFDFLMPGYLFHYAKFRKLFETPIVKQKDPEAAKRLRQMVSPFILRRMKSEVLRELPEKIETVLYAELNGEQKKLYAANALQARKTIETVGTSGADKLQILAMLTRLRQLCCDPSLIYEDYGHGSAKLELCMDLAQSCVESGHRVLLFSQFTSMLERISKRLDESGISYLTITGETKSGKRLELVNAFNQGEGDIFLISLKAGGTGLNLTGADVVIHYDPWWNSSAQNQATDRAHRIGQTKSVQVYKLIAKDTLEERILDMQKNKAGLADMIVREGDGAFARMSREEIIALFT